MTWIRFEWRSRLGALAGLSMLASIACGDPSGGADGGGGPRDAGSASFDADDISADPDGDGIPNWFENAESMFDTDRDGTPDYLDEDSDDDGIPDSIEGGNPGGQPVDSDEDGQPDFRDEDSDANGVSDATEGADDLDGDGLGNYRDTDNDGDFLTDQEEFNGPSTSPDDSDEDGVPDYNDPDSDNDFIGDAFEQREDTDGDRIPDRLDLNSDGDSIPDAEEAGDEDLSTIPVDTDMDLVPDFRDADSDADGLSDRSERAGGTSPVAVDTDGDGVSDLIETTAGTDPNDGADNPSARGDFVFLVPFEEAPDPPRDTLDFSTDLQVADIYFMMDNTGSMGDSIASIQAELRDSIIPGIRAEIPDTYFGLGGFRDYPCCGYGTTGDNPFFHLLDMTGDAMEAQTATAGYEARGGGDAPESQAPALFALASGMGLPGGGSTVVGRSGGCPPRTWGYACFRPIAVPVVVLITDQRWHNASGGTDPYDDGMLGGWHAPTYFEAVTALNDRGVRVIGVSQFGGGRADLLNIARDTGAVDGTGAPLVTNYAGGSITSQIVTAIQTMARNTNLDISVVYTDDDGDTVDTAAAFLDHVEANVSGALPRGCDPRAAEDRDSDGVVDTFPAVRSGDAVCFDIVAKQNDTVAATQDPQLFRATVQILGDGFTPLGEARDVFFLVPPVPPEVGGPD